MLTVYHNRHAGARQAVDKQPALVGATSPYGFGSMASMRAFGHSGHQSSTGFADPEHGLVVAWVLNGMPGEKRHDQRLREIDAAIYGDLGFARGSGSG